MLRALVVEDDRSWRQILSELLADAGLAVDVAESYETALATLRAAPHRLAVVDLSLGGSDHRNQDGLRVLAAVRQLDPGCTAMLLSGYATVEIAVAAMRTHGAYTCLRKERFRRAEFRALVQDILAEPPSSLPTLAAPPADGPAGPEPQREERRQPATVLVVEDDAGWRSILAELIADAGCESRASSSYGEALAQLQRAKPDLAVVDLALASSLNPDDNTDGYRLLAALQQAGIPAIVVSGAASPSDAERAVSEYAAFAFVEKQAFERRSFVRSLIAALDQAPAADAHLAHLTGREREVLDLLVEGLTNKQIAARLVISPNTVKRHLKSVFAKLGVNTRAAAVAKAMGEGV